MFDVQKRVVVDGNDHYTVFYFRSNTFDGDTRFYDISAGKTGTHSWTVTGTGITHQVEYRKFGSSSINHNGSMSCFTVADSPDYDLGTEWTIDFWFWSSNNDPQVDGAQRLIRFYNMPTNGLQLYLQKDDDPTPGGLIVIAGDVIRYDTLNICDSTWHHIAIVLDHGIVYTYIDGIKRQQDATDDVFDGSTSWIFGALSVTSSPFVGYMEEFRISKVARWRSGTTFKPPLQPFRP